jgi:hypothetical protein
MECVSDSTCGNPSPSRGRLTQERVVKIEAGIHLETTSAHPLIDLVIASTAWQRQTWSQ